MGITITNKTIDKYFSFLSRLDNHSKEKLILKLTESIKADSTSAFDLRSLFGAWEDDKDTDEIIKEIREGRINH